jgi:hypothetical protein
MILRLATASSKRSVREGQPSVPGASEIEDIAKLPAFKVAPP